MSELTERARISDLIQFELAAEHGWCRKKAILSQDGSATEDVEIGTILQADGADYVPCTTGASATAILLTHVPKADTIAGDVDVVVLYRGPALVKSAGLTIASNQLANAKTALAVLLVDVRDVPSKYEEGL